jgi:hypothetical protein
MKRLAVGLALVALVLSAVTAYAGEIQLPLISVTPTSYDFGQVPVYAVAQGALLVTNDSADSDLIVTAVKTKAPFSDGASSFTLGPGQSRRVSIAFAPPAPGQYNSYCTFISNAANHPVLNVPLSGTGVAQ